MMQPQSNGRESPKLNLRGGFFLYIVLQVTKQKHDGLKVIYEEGLPFGGPGIRLALDERDALFFEVIDGDGTPFSTPAIENQRFLGRWMIAFCGLQHLDDNESRLSLEIHFLDVDAEFSVERRIRGCWGEEVDVMLSAGASILGEAHTALSLRAFGIFSGVPTIEERSNMVAAVRAEHR